MLRLDKLPWWVTLPASAGITAMTAFVPDISPFVRGVGFTIGAALFVWSMAALLWHVFRSRGKLSTKRAQSKLKRAFAEARPAFEETNAGLQMMVVEHDENALAYARTLSNLIQTTGITVSAITNQIPTKIGQSGVVVTTLDEAKPTALAVCIKQALESAGIKAVFGPLPPVFVSQQQSRVVGIFVVTAP